jgi:nucleoside-diphosphate-sugar epimerase
VFPFKKTILITGIDGFTGFHLEKKLEKKFNVFGTSISKSGDRVFKMDINDRSGLTSLIEKIKPNYIIHLAAISFVNQSNAKLFYEVNTIGTETLIESILESGVPLEKVIIPSSATVYGNQSSGVLNEEMVPKPTNHYGCSKLAMENIVANYFQELPIIITRPFNYTGRYQNESFIVPKLIKHFLTKSDSIELGNINTKREFNSVDFISEVYVKLLECESKSLIVNVCSGRMYSIAQIISLLSGLTGHEINVKRNPNFIRKNEIFELCGSVENLSNIIELPLVEKLEDTLNEMLETNF